MEKIGVQMPEGKLEDMMHQAKQEWGFAGPRCGGGGHGGMKKQRAIIVSKPTQTLEASPGQTILPSIEVKNATHWSWKKGCFLGMDENVEIAGLPIEVVNIPIDFEVKGQETFKIQVAIKIHDHVFASDKEYEFVLCFKGPNGGQFGEPIPLKIKVFPNSDPVSEKDEIEFYRIAIKLHDLLKLGKNFEEVV